jgi:hypothetical protein
VWVEKETVDLIVLPLHTQASQARQILNNESLLGLAGSGYKYASGFTEDRRQNNPRLDLDLDARVAGETRDFCVNYAVAFTARGSRGKRDETIDEDAQHASLLRGTCGVGGQPWVSSAGMFVELS